MLPCAGRKAARPGVPLPLAIALDRASGEIGLAGQHARVCLIASANWLVFQRVPWLEQQPEGQLACLS